jgi:hypothetical protein
MSGTRGSEVGGSARRRRLGGAGDRTRAQSITIGALFLFAFLILSLAIVQTVFVPEENGQVEFNHNKQVQDDMVDLRSDLLRSAATGQPRSSAVQLGTAYPSRTLLLNPPSPSGTLRTTERANISLTNAAASGAAGDYFDGGNRTFRTKAVVYRPSYNVYTDAPETVIGSSILYERYPGSGGDTATPGSNQTVINSRTISLVALRGSYYESGATAASIDPRVLSATNRTVTVTDDGDPVVLKLPTRLSEQRWRELLSGERDPGPDDTEPDRYVDEVSCGPDYTEGEPCGIVRITMEPGVEYNLRMGAVGLGSPADREAVTNAPWYVVTTGGNGSTVAEGRTRQLTFEVRDRFNNPVSGATLAVGQPRTGYVTDGEAPAESPIELTTDRNGRATVTYHAPLNVRRSLDASFTAELPGGTVEPRERVDATLTVQDDADAVADSEWRRPLIEVVEHEPQSAGGAAVDGSETAEFVRVQVPDAGEYELRDDDGNSVAFDVDPTAVPDTGTLDYYLVEQGATLDGPCADRVGTSNAADLTFPLDTGSDDRLGLTLVRTDAPSGGTVVRDSLTVRAPSDGNGTGTDFARAGLGLRRIEDGAHVDSNRTLDWNTTVASNTAVCGEATDRMEVIFEGAFDDGDLGATWDGRADDPDTDGTDNGVQGVDSSVDRFGGAAYIGGNPDQVPAGDDSRIRSAVSRSTRPYAEVVVSFAAYDAGRGEDPDGPDLDEPNEGLVVEYCTDATDANGGDADQCDDPADWQETGRVTPIAGTGPVGAQSFRIERSESPEAFATGFRVRLRQPEATEEDRWYVDGLVVAGG